MFRNVVILVIVLAVVGLLVGMRRKKRLFEIRVGEEDVIVLGPVPNHDQREVRAFLKPLRLPVGSRIVAIEERAGFRLEFSRAIRLDDRERVATFLRR
ncbi:MAG: hypothetical protein KC635_09480 [Myxococcales bacterium]|nr:hypothetical protein [Myxococcales bacterium]MCB9732677.1 hypothetical protein [Deltaproteobacteria bacterium]